MSGIKKILYWFSLSLLTVSTMVLILFYMVWNSSDDIDPSTLRYYSLLKNELRSRGFEDDAVMIVGGKRSKLHNSLLVFLGSSPTSTHLSGRAMDILVMDINGDGRMDDEDVDVVYGLLDEKIMRGKGGIGTYKEEWGFWNTQTVHLDSRDDTSRWNR